MAERLTASTYIYSAELTEVEDLGATAADKVLHALTVCNHSDTDEAAVASFTDILRTYSPDAAAAVAGLARAISHLSVVASRDEPLQAAALTHFEHYGSVEGQGGWVAAVGSINRQHPLKVIEVEGITPGVKILSLNLRFEDDGHPCVDGRQGEIPTRKFGDYGGYVRDITYKPSDEISSWNVYSGFAEMVVIGSAVGDVLRRNGFEHHWNSYSATRDITD